MDSTAFDFLCDALEEQSSLDRLEARGTIRLALRKAGLDARSVSGEQLAVIVQKLLPQELDARGLADVEPLCERLARGISTFEGGPASESGPEAVFTRLGES